jgi:VIT1/CCC1 family predicted Fe2+/Mn2+ transporter
VSEDTEEKDRFRADLATIIAGSKVKADEEWLRHLHASYVTRYLADNDRTWSTATLLVPLSLAAFPVFLSLTAPSMQHLFGYAFASTLLMLLWFGFATAHRQFLARSMDVIRALEKYALGADAERALREKLLEETPNMVIGVHTLRLLLVGITIVGWVALGLTLWSLPDWFDG